MLVGLAIALVGVGSVCLIRYPKREKVERPPFSLDRFILVKALPTALAYLLSAIPYGMVVSFVVLYGKEINVSNPGYFFIFMAIGVGTARLISGRLVDHGKIHLVSISALVFLTLSFAVFALFINELFFCFCAGDRHRIRCLCPGYPVSFRKCRSASYAWNGNFHLSDIF